VALRRERVSSKELAYCRRILLVMFCTAVSLLLQEVSVVDKAVADDYGLNVPQHLQQQNLEINIKLNIMLMLT
jgi:hypothetical protein